MKRRISIIFACILFTICMCACKTKEDNTVIEQPIEGNVEEVVEETVAVEPEPVAEPESEMEFNVPEGISKEDIAKALQRCLSGEYVSPLIEARTYKDITELEGVCDAAGYNLYDFTHDGIPDLITADGCSMYVYKDGEYELFFHDWASQNFYADNYGNFIVYDEWPDFDGNQQYLLKGCMYCEQNDVPMIEGYYPPGCSGKHEYVIDSNWLGRYFKEDSREPENGFKLEAFAREDLSNYIEVMLDEGAEEPELTAFTLSVEDLQNYTLLVPKWTDFTVAPKAAYAFSDAYEDCLANITSYYKQGLINMQ